ncbi:ketoacyl-ACP synthase III [Myxococcota bacterium]|nr:ketoacyl-ACP synthase III [Myxococcota bacterium]
MTTRAKITGTGMYVPERVVKNDDLAALMETSDDWIRQRTGIEERRYIDPGTQPADLAYAAASNALESAKLKPSDIDCVILATLSAQADFPGTSFFLQEKLDAGEIPCFDLRAQCSGFVYSLSVANSFVRAGTFRRVLAVGCEVHSTGIDISTEGRDVAVLFGDGAGAVVVEANDDPSDPSEILAVNLHAEGRHAKRLWVEIPGSGNTPDRITPEMLAQKRHYPHMEGRFVFKNAVTRMPEVLRETVASADVGLDDVDLFLFHQANLRINEFVANQLEIPAEKCLNNIQRYGNCSAASIPILLDEAARSQRLEPGNLVSMTTFGSGFSWSSALVRW